ncbi:MAG: hypothetical protein ACTHMQ_12020 [Protaetiibacter sp.]
MSENPEARTEHARDALRRDARRELWLIPQAVLAALIVAAVVWVRQAFFV